MCPCCEGKDTQGNIIDPPKNEDGDKKPKVDPHGGEGDHETPGNDNPKSTKPGRRGGSPEGRSKNPKKRVSIQASDSTPENSDNGPSEKDRPRG